MKLDAAFGGVSCLIAMAVSVVAWGLLGATTGIWIDGCPDVVAAYVETHGACPPWWRDIYLIALPPVLLGLSVYIGLWTTRMVSGRRKP
jgi:hypothetical protein